jgi:glycosyltransferase involved in cell wall biosynthesis
MPEKVSVIVTVYDRNELIDRCMESITGQTLSDIEILCISSLEKKNKKCIDDWCTRDSRVRQIDTSLYMTVAEALNAAIDIAGGEYIAFIDTDDYYYEKNALELLADACAKNNTDIAGAGIVEVNMFNADVRTQFDGIYSGYVFEKDGVTEYREYACCTEGLHM